MIEYSGSAYAWIKALHVISVIAWMAALLYLPRLFVYHAEAKSGSELSETLKVMERRLTRGIMNPAMVASLLFGALMLVDKSREMWSDGWMQAKLALVVGLLGMHMLLAGWRRDFAADRNTRPQKFYRMVNEVPAVLMVGIVVLVIVRPF